MRRARREVSLRLRELVDLDPQASLAGGGFYFGPGDGVFAAGAFL